MRLVRLYAVIILVAPILLLLHLLLSAVLAGGQVVANARPLWGAVVAYPVLLVPDWLVIALAAAALVLVVPIVVLTTARRSAALVALFRFTLAAIAADGFFAFAFPRAQGLVERLEGTTPGWHWIGAVLAAVCAIVLVVRIVMTNAEHTRLLRSGSLEP